MKYSLKNSGIEWMGEVPSSWIISKNRYFLKHKKNKKNQSEDTQVLSLTVKGIKIKKDLSFGKSTESYIGHQMVDVGDIVFTPRDFDQTPILSDVSKYQGCISNLYIVDETKEGLDSHFLNYYWYGLKYSFDYFKNFSHGMRYSFNRFQFDEIPLLKPPITEQKQIVSFLDQKIEFIDSLKKKISRRVLLLKEQKDSVVNELVTTGIDPNVNLKVSDIEWLDKTPTHWETLPLMSVCDETKENNQDNETTVLTLSYGKLKVRNVESNFGLLPESFENYQRIRPGYIVLRLLDLQNDKKSLRVGHSYIDGIITPVYVSLKCKECMDSEFLYFYLHNSDIKKVLYSLGGGLRQTLRFGELKKLPILVPPINEQKLIVKNIKKILQNIDTKITSEERRMKLLTEYKQSLISEVVTGKKRVV